MGMSAPRENHQSSDEETAELLGAYALNACEPDEAAAVEELLARRPDLAAEAARLSSAARTRSAATSAVAISSTSGIAVGRRLASRWLRRRRASSRRM